jgi:hypothetical protein
MASMVVLQVLARMDVALLEAEAAGINARAAELERKQRKLLLTEGEGAGEKRSLPRHFPSVTFPQQRACVARALWPERHMIDIEA